MTLAEAEAIAAVAATADGGCFYCVHDLCDRLNKAGLGFHWKVLTGDGDTADQVVVRPLSREEPNDAV